MLRRGGQRQEHALLAEAIRHRQQTLARDDDARRGTAEQAVDLTVATRTRDEDPLADRAAALGARLDHASDRLVARHQRVAHAREGRHATGPEQTLRARADAAEVDVHHAVGRRRRRQRELAHRKAARLLQHNGLGRENGGGCGGWGGVSHGLGPMDVVLVNRWKHGAPGTSPVNVVSV
jgi:hypothetical protein